jgi:serine/threonine-protein kinase
MFALLSGRFVHQAETANEALVAAVTQRAPSLGSVAPHLHPQIVSLVDKVLSYERELRFQTATEFRVALHLADAAIAGDEASPSLRVPLDSMPSVVQAGPLALTTEGVAASVRGAQTNPSLAARPHTKAIVALSGLAAGALIVLLGRGLFGSAGKQATLASPSHANQPALVAPAAPAVDDRAPEVIALGPAPAPDESALALPATPAPKPHPIVARASVSAVAAPKLASPKTAADLLKKRH